VASHTRFGQDDETVRRRLAPFERRAGSSFDREKTEAIAIGENQRGDTSLALAHRECLRCVASTVAPVTRLVKAHSANACDGL
jgi:hypothetical protein